MRRFADWRFLSVTGIAAVALVFALLNLTVHGSNRARQAEVVQRQQFINQSVQLSRLNTQFIQALAQLSAETDDESIRRILADNGVTFTINKPTTDEATDE